MIYIWTHGYAYICYIYSKYFLLVCDCSVLFVMTFVLVSRSFKFLIKLLFHFFFLLPVITFCLQNFFKAPIMKVFSYVFFQKTNTFNLVIWATIHPKLIFCMVQGRHHMDMQESLKRLSFLYSTESFSHFVRN